MFRRTALSVAALAAAALLLESALTRLLAVAQYYHFAFLVVSLALLGFGASGTFLSLRKTQTPNPHIYRLAGAGFAASTLLAYATINWLPFDSYTIAWERRQLLYFALYYLILALPFFCSGVGIGAGLAIGGGRGHLVYAANLFGSALGVLLALVALALAGVPGAVLASIAIALLPAVIGPAGSERRLVVCARPLAGGRPDRDRRGRLRRADPPERPGPRAAGAGDLAVQGSGARAALSRCDGHVREVERHLAG